MRTLLERTLLLVGVLHLLYVVVDIYSSRVFELLQTLSPWLLSYVLWLKIKLWLRIFESVTDFRNKDIVMWLNWILISVKMALEFYCTFMYRLLHIMRCTVFDQAKKAPD